MMNKVQGQSPLPGILIHLFRNKALEPVSHKIHSGDSTVHQADTTSRW